MKGEVVTITINTQFPNSTKYQFCFQIKKKIKNKITNEKKIVIQESSERTSRHKRIRFFFDGGTWAKIMMELRQQKKI